MFNSLFKPDTIKPPATNKSNTKIFNMILISILVTALLLKLARHQYLLFHIVVEMGSISVAVAVFLVVWNAREFIHQKALIFLGTALLFTAIFDFIHTVTYIGMGLVKNINEAEVATQLWISARWIEALSILAFTGMLTKKKLGNIGITIIFIFVSGAILLSIFEWKIFPSCYIPGSGLTSFKIISEFLICIIFIGAMYRLYAQKTVLSRSLYNYLQGAILLSVFSELSFTVYTDLDGVFNLLGHLFKIGAYLCVYLGLIREGLSRPYALLFKEVKENEKRLEASEAKLKSILNEAPDAVFVFDMSGQIYHVNENACSTLGYTNDELLSMNISTVNLSLNTSRLESLWGELAEGKSPLHTAVHKQKNGHVFSVETKSGTIQMDDMHFAVSFARDISDRKVYQQERDLTLRLLKTMDVSGSLNDLMGEVTRLFKNWLNCDAVGIKLKNNRTEYLTIYETKGIPNHFIHSENYICSTGVNGKTVRHHSGNTVSECICEMMLNRPGDPDKPFFTEHGSFWTGNTFQFIQDAINKGNLTKKSLSQCLDQGYKSMALIPLCAGGDVLGLVQLCDHREDQFSENQIKIFERLADNLALALSQRLTATALEESEKRFRSYFMANPIMTFTFKKRARGFIFTECNTAAHEYTTGDISRFIDMSAADIWPDRPDITESIHSAFQNQTTTQMDTHYVLRTSGAKSFFHMSCTYVAPDSVMIHVEDISERRNTLSALRESERKLSTLITNLPGMVYRCKNDAWWTMEFVSPGSIYCTGYRPEEITLNAEIDYASIIHPEDRSHVRNTVESGLATGKLFEIEYRIIRKDGTVRWVWERGAGIFKQDKLIAIEGFISDIHVRKEALADIQRLATAIDQVAEMIMITDPMGCIQYVNPAFEKITGYTQQEALGQHPSILKSDHHDEAFYQKLWSTLTQGMTWSGKIINKRKNGTDYHEEMVVSPVKDESGNIINFVAVKRDITKEMNLEDQLRQSQKMEAVGNLAGGVAHDFNNMLSPILGYAEMILDDMHPQDHRYDQLSEIKKAAERSRDLTRQLLSFSKKQALELKPVDIGTVLKGMEKLLRRMLREDIDLSLIIGEGKLSALADVGQIEQILMNLAVNAQDAMPDGGEIHMEINSDFFHESQFENQPSLPPGQYVFMKISDTGIGISPAMQNHIFEPFFTTKDQGTGLGLATVYGIVKQHGGNISVSSEQDMGTTFKIYLPSIDPAPDESISASGRISNLNGSESVLVAEDNIMVRELAVRILEKNGYFVLTAENGQEAIELVEEKRTKIDLLLTDVVMPDINGKELAQALSRDPSCIGMKILYMSGYTDTIINNEDITSPGTGFIQKPFSARALAVKVRDILDN